MKYGLGWPEQCPDGFNCDQPGWIFECEPGTYASENHRECLDCPKGFKCVKGMEIKCQSGTLANSTRQARFNRTVVLEPISLCHCKIHMK